MKRVAIGGLHTECSSYSPLEQTAEDFTRVEGAALTASVPFDFAGHGIRPIPILHDRSVPGGPVAAATFDAQRAEFMRRLRAAMPLDGVLLLMHGAMFVPGIDDPEGDFIAEIRQIVGPDAIISAAFDLHGQITERICDALDGFAAYRTAPHVDVPLTWTRAATILARALAGGPRPSVIRVPIPILVSGEMSSTFVAPCDRLYAALADHDAAPGIEDANLMIGYVWADSPRATAAAVVTATDRRAGEDTARAIARAYRDALPELAFDMVSLPLPDAFGHVAHGPAILADSGDNPTAGGVGDRADVLRHALDAGLGSVLIAGIADPVAHAALQQGAETITLGGSLGGGGPRFELTPDLCRFAEGCAVIAIGGITVVISARRRPFHHLSDFAKLGLTLGDFRLLVVKSGYLSPELRELPRRQVMALTEGAVCQDISRLTNDHRPRGTWPFDQRDAHGAPFDV
ncbi:M81 family metallopeptidase [Paracoccus sp. 1_MG-2023]|uniref:M81 family metallopeptidase n=1 Tax=unclassified Paracoccus (in: a-proteobacteria) TaxID=2688777 RepID=UPI001C0A31EF|nr:M81 family metallopeptidase [Paracoccus sp. 1_MG-2023]MBU2956331.1 M81 family metallopeptidase [Paracoccus sp. C2R09]MDO6668007.1 M81 family metallopeptidase [Paracoccus sp. 1_MG-2023]